MTGIALDNNQQFSVRRGDFFIPLSTDLQDEGEILYANKANFLESPTLGIAITYFLNSPISKPELERLIRKEFEKDNISVVSVSVKQIDNDDFDIILKTSRNDS